jgi:hypothetical protein
MSDQQISDQIQKALTRLSNFDIEGARKAGYSSHDIVTYLAFTAQKLPRSSPWNSATFFYLGIALLPLFAGPASWRVGRFVVLGN